MNRTNKGRERSARGSFGFDTYEHRSHQYSFPRRGQIVCPYMASCRCGPPMAAAFPVKAAPLVSPIIKDEIESVLPDIIENSIVSDAPAEQIPADRIIDDTPLETIVSISDDPPPQVPFIAPELIRNDYPETNPFIPDSIETREYEREREDYLHGRGLLHYIKWWKYRNIDVSVNGSMLSGIPAFWERDTLRVINDDYSYFIPTGKCRLCADARRAEILVRA